MSVQWPRSVAPYYTTWLIILVYTKYVWVHVLILLEDFCGNIQIHFSIKSEFVFGESTKHVMYHRWRISQLYSRKFFQNSIQENVLDIVICYVIASSISSEATQLVNIWLYDFFASLSVSSLLYFRCSWRRPIGPDGAGKYNTSALIYFNPSMDK